MAFGRVFTAAAGTVFVACAAVLAAVRARWTAPAAPIGLEDLSALGVAVVAAMAALLVALRHGRPPEAEAREGSLLHALVDAALAGSAVLLIAWLELVQPLGLRVGLDLISYTALAVAIAAAGWRASGRSRIDDSRATLAAYIPALLAATLYGISVLNRHTVDPLTLAMAVTMFGMFAGGQLLVVMENARLSRALGDTRAKLRYRAGHDPLTDLPNRALFQQRVEVALAKRRRANDGICTVMFVDLDDFKNVNDTIGHAGGDGVLIEVARRLRESLRTADVVARLGGDEFGLLFEQVTAAGDLLEVAERLVAELRAPMEIDGVSVEVPATLGIALHGPAEPPADAGDLLQRADVALRLAKQRGKGRFGLFEPSMHVAMDEPRRRRSGLDRALAMREFRLHFQPIVEVRTRQIVGAEALLRWQHPEAGLLGPDEFLSDLEDVGLIAEVGRWVIDEGVAQAASLRNEIGVEFFLAVNVSSLQLHDPGFVDAVRRSLALAGLPPSALVVELTESGSVAEDPIALTRLRGLRALGVRLAIDDFGTGYSSMAYLHSFPVDVLKIDKSFIADLVEGSPDRRLAEELTRLGSSLGLLTIAEGVETEAQHGALDVLGCPLAQGFFYAGALPRDQLAGSLRAAGKPQHMGHWRSA
jgi:diguanylate cyclase (GGDEF)-like protein